MLKQDLEIVRGDTVKLNIEVKTENNLPFNLDGAIVFLTVKENYNQPDSDAVIQIFKTTHENATGGITILTLTNSHTDALNPSKVYYYDIQIVKGSEVYTIATGTIKVIPDITRRTGTW